MTVNVLPILANHMNNGKFNNFKELVQYEIDILKNSKDNSKSLKNLKITLFEIQAFNIVSDYYSDLDLTRIIYIKDLDKRQNIIKEIINNCEDRNKLRAIIMEVLLTNK